MCVCICVHACGGERGWLCMSIYEGWVQVVCNGYGINWGQKVWVVVAVCVCVCMCLFSENWRALKQALKKEEPDEVRGLRTRG